jgi:AcrR family transcriptional regulator
MPYPSKTSAQAILKTASARVEASGLAGLNMRALALSLGITPRSLYRYFPDRASLEAGIAELGLRRLRYSLERALSGSEGTEAIRKGARSYLRFAKTHRRLYAVMMTGIKETPGLRQARQELWALVVSRAERLVGPELASRAAIALWALLHGFAQLEDSLSEGKPKDGFEIGLEGLLLGLAGLSSQAKVVQAWS